MPFALLLEKQDLSLQVLAQMILWSDACEVSLKEIPMLIPKASMMLRLLLQLKLVIKE
jgi:hypothetical protein